MLSRCFSDYLNQWFSYASALFRDWYSDEKERERERERDLEEILEEQEALNLKLLT